MSFHSTLAYFFTSLLSENNIEQNMILAPARLYNYLRVPQLSSRPSHKEEIEDCGLWSLLPNERIIGVMFHFDHKIYILRSALITLLPPPPHPHLYPGRVDVPTSIHIYSLTVHSSWVGLEG